MLRALVIYHTNNNDTKLLAVKIKNRLEDIGMDVSLFEDIQFKEFQSVRDYSVIALGAPCLTCKKCRGAQECRAAKKLRKNLKKLFATNLQDKKLITFAQSPHPEKHEWIRQRIESLIAPTKIKPVASIGYPGRPPDNLDDTIRTSIQEQKTK